MNRILIFLLFICPYSNANNDSIKSRLDNLEAKLMLTQDKIEQIKQGQLTYQIEKDLLKETYSNNYDRINTVVTIILGIIGILAYFGIRDINSIKREYQNELENLRKVKTEFEIKSESFETEKNKVEKEIKEIIKQNEEQNRKIKLIELKEKVSSLIKDKNLYSALEFANVALDISPNDLILLIDKALILSRLNQIPNAKIVLEKALALDPANISIIKNTVECYYLLNEIEKAKGLITTNKSVFESDESKEVLNLFELIEMYHKRDKNSLLYKTNNFLNVADLKTQKKRFLNWSLEEVKVFILFEVDSESKTIFQNIIWYLDGQLSGESLCKTIGIPLPENNL
jgi:tetratricopeptide (TPR) repeat protein